LGVGSLEFGVGSWELGVGSLEFGVWSLEFGVEIILVLLYQKTILDIKIGC
jgi:hypothetical protein